MASFNKILETAGEKASTVADNISSSQFFKNVIPGKEVFAKEVDAYIASNEKIRIGLNSKAAENKLRTGLDVFASYNDSISPIDIDNAVKSVKQANFSQESFDELQDLLGEKFNPQKFKQKIDKELNKQPENIPGYAKPGIYGAAYFNPADKKVKAQRIGTVIGAYATTAVGARYAQGGSITTDQYGQKDIAGIPFI